jgi:DNA polymerase-3 subunit alpha
MYGVPSFLRECAKANIKPIVGMETDVHYHDAVVPFLLLAKDNKGYYQLMQLSSLLSRAPEQVDLDALNACAAHCFIIAYGEGGWMDSELIKEDTQHIIEKLKIMKEEISSFDIALSYQESAMWKKRNQMLKQICSNFGISTCAVNKVQYLNQDDNKAVQILNGIKANKTLHDSSLLLPTGRYYLNQEEMKQLFDEDDLARTDAIAKECKADCMLEKASLPKYHVPKESVSSQEYLKGLCAAGLKKRLQGRMDPAYVERLKYELGVICKMQYEDYFLIVFDFIRHARKSGINVGPGRGSAVGSLVAYCLGITMIDPMKYHLLFERFLNPERISMPDIDTDIPDDRREEVIQYVADTYGKENVADIVTFNTLGPKQAIRDVGKVLNINEEDINMVLRKIPQKEKTTLYSAYKMNPSLKQIVDASSKLSNLYRMANMMEGLPRHTGIHAAGIVISAGPIQNYVPVNDGGEGLITTQYTYDYLEERGLIKMDFLGLKNLRTINDIVLDIQKEHPSFVLQDIPLDDADVYKAFANADTTGIFQFETETFKPKLRKMHPVCFEDLVAANALNRPGASSNIDMYIANKQNPDKIQYPSAALKEVLQETYGVMIYQEQVMLALQKAAGFSLGKADILRRAISKKKSDVMTGMRKEFVDGCIRNHYTKEAAEQLYDYIEKFSGYGFNKSHSVAYSYIAYQLAYLKVKYPMYFYSALLNSVISDQDKTSQYVDECRRRGIKILYPDVNASAKRYLGAKGEIRLPLSAISGIGINLSDAIVTEREQNGPYKDFFDFVARVLVLKVKRDQITALIDGGAADCFQIGRATCRHVLDDALRYAQLVQIKNGDQISINLGLVSRPEVIRMKDDEMENSERERDVLGFNLGVQPITRIRQENGIQLPSLAVLRSSFGIHNGFAMISFVKPHRTKKGDMMAFVTLTDETGQADMCVMPRLYAQKMNVLARGAYICFNVKIEEGRSFLANEIQVIRKK